RNWRSSTRSSRLPAASQMFLSRSTTGRDTAALVRECAARFRGVVCDRAHELWGPKPPDWPLAKRGERGSRKARRSKQTRAPSARHDPTRKRAPPLGAPAQPSTRAPPHRRGSPPGSRIELLELVLALGLFVGA